MKFWLDDMNELLKFQIIIKKNMNDVEYYNTLSRIVLFGSSILYLTTKKAIMLIIGIAALFGIVIIYRNSKENMVNYNNEYPETSHNLYNSDLVYTKPSTDDVHDYNSSDKINEKNNPININRNYYKYYNHRNNLSRKKQFHSYTKFLDFLYPQRKLQFCKEMHCNGCYKVWNSIYPNKHTSPNKHSSVDSIENYEIDNSSEINAISSINIDN